MNLPTKLTILRILLVPVFVVLYFVKFPFNGLVAVAVFMIACFTDFLDGHLARKWNQVTTLGKFLDPIADKILVMCAVVCVVVSDNRGGAIGVCLAIFLMIIESRELIVSCFRIIAASKGVNLAADKWGKLKTVCQMISLILLVPYASLCSEIGSDVAWLSVYYYIGFSLLALATVFTIISGCNYILKNKAVLSDGENK